MAVSQIAQKDAGWWGACFGVLFLAFVLYSASRGSLSKYKAWLF